MRCVRALQKFFATFFYGRHEVRCSNTEIRTLNFSTHLGQRLITPRLDLDVRRVTHLILNGVTNRFRGTIWDIDYIPGFDCSIGGGCGDEQTYATV